MDDKIQHRGHVVTARRRLLQGAVAAPAVLTLYSGSALANESAMRCVVNHVDNPLQGVAPTLSSPSDGLVRVRLWSLRPNASASYATARWFVRGDDLDALANRRTDVTNASITTGQWLEYKPPEVLSPISTPTGTLLQDGAWVAVRFDVHLGPVIMGVVGSGTGGAPVPGSCWTSFATSAY
jgi:hypothetical protein